MAQPLDLDTIQAIADRAHTDPFYLADCEGDLSVWRESALQHVTRNEAGEITGYCTPSSYRATDHVIAIDLDSWDPGEDASDDQRRQDITDLVTARAKLPALLAEVRRLRAELTAETAPFHLHSATAIADADNPTQLRWGLDDVMWGDDDTVTVLLSGPDGEPYWLELDRERAAVLRRDLAGPDGEQPATDSRRVQCNDCGAVGEVFTGGDGRAYLNPSGEIGFASA